MSSINQVEIAARDCFQYPVFVEHAGQVIEWSFSTKRKSIAFALFFHRGSAATPHTNTTATAATNIGSNNQAVNVGVTAGMSALGLGVDAPSSSASSLSDHQKLPRPLESPDKPVLQLPTQPQNTSPSSMNYLSPGGANGGNTSPGILSPPSPGRLVSVPTPQPVASSSTTATSNVAATGIQGSPMTATKTGLLQKLHAKFNSSSASETRFVTATTPMSGLSASAIAYGSHAASSSAHNGYGTPPVSASHKQSSAMRNVSHLHPDWECILPGRRYYAESVAVKGRYQAREAGTFVLVFDNSFSRSTSKKVTFWVKVVDGIEDVVKSIEPSMEGWLYKKKRRKNQGYAKRWVTLSGGILSYYLTPGSACRGSVSVYSASISVVPDQRLIVVDSGSLVYYFRTVQDQELAKWVEAIRFYRTKLQPAATRSESPSGEDQTINFSANDVLKHQLREIQGRLQHLRDSLSKTHEDGYHSDTSPSKPRPSRPLNKYKDSDDMEEILSEMDDLFYAMSSCAATLSRAVNRSSREFQGYDDFETASNRGSVYYDVQQDIVLESGQASSLSSKGNEDQAGFELVEDSSDGTDEDMSEFGSVEQLGSASKRPSRNDLLSLSGNDTTRIALPVNMPSETISFLSILRKNIGKDLSSVAMPVLTNEPLNLLQKLCEELEYSELLDRAVQQTSSLDRLKFIAAFAVSGYASSAFRSSRKPFNPLLGETFEYVREDKKFRFMSEKVHHNPHIMACHAESESYVFWQTNQVKSSFWGKSVELSPIGTVSVRLKQHNETYEWNKVNAHVNVIGQYSIEHYGELVIRNLNTGEMCKITFKESSLFASAKRAVTGTIFNAEGYPQLTLSGNWSDALYQDLGDSRLEILWTVNPLPAHASYQYGFTAYAMDLNHLPETLWKKLPKTDTRFRPDQRHLELGQVEEADEEKTRLETKQRQVRKERELRNEHCEPRWFRKQGEDTYVYRGGYWEARSTGDFGDLPDLW